MPLAAWIALTCVTSVHVDANVTTLPNGITVAVEESRSAPTVAIDIFVRAGSVRETPDTLGAAHMLEHLAFRGTTNHPGNDLDKRAEALGYQLQANTQREITHYFATCLASDWKEVLGLLADAVMNPAPTAQAFSREKRVVAQEYLTRRDNPIEFTLDRLYQLAYGSAGYAAPTGGTPPSIQAITLDKVLEFHKRWYTTGNLVVSITGDVGIKEAADAVNLWFGEMHRGVPDPYPTVAEPSATVLDEAGPFLRCAVALGFSSPPASRIADSAALDVLMNLILARGPREDAIAFDTRYNTLSGPGLAAMLAFCEEAKLPAVLAKLDAIVSDLGAGNFSEAEFQAARDQTQGGELFQGETNAGRAYAIGYWTAVGNSATDEGYRKKLASLDFASVKRVAHEVFDPAREIRLIWRPAKRSGE